MLGTAGGKTITVIHAIHDSATLEALDSCLSTEWLQRVRTTRTLTWVAECPKGRVKMIVG
jgi:hypothetical protein